MKTPRKRRDGARPAVPPDVELRPTGDPPPDGQPALDQSLVAPSWLPERLARLYAEHLTRSATGPSDLLPWLADSADEQPAPDPNARAMSTADPGRKRTSARVQQSPHSVARTAPHMHDRFGPPEPLGPQQPLRSPQGLTLPHMMSSGLPAIDPGDRRSSSRTTLSAGDGATSSGPICTSMPAGTAGALS